jgi:hypothetical protein
VSDEVVEGDSEIEELVEVALVVCVCFGCQPGSLWVRV